MLLHSSNPCLQACWCVFLCVINQNIQCNNMHSAHKTYIHITYTYEFFIMDDIVIAGWIRVSVGCLLAVKQSIFENRCIALNDPRYIILIPMIAECRLQNKFKFEIKIKIESHSSSIKYEMQFFSVATATTITVKTIQDATFQLLSTTVHETNRIKCAHRRDSAESQ